MAPQIYQLCDSATGALLLAMIAAAPWLFGATEPWSIRLLNALGFACGALLLVKWLLRWSSGAVAVESVMSRREPKLAASLWMVRAMAVLTAAAVFYCLVAALNARATFVPEEQRLQYHERYAPWLPFTYDSHLTWTAFWNYAALACAFWSLRDWLLHPASPRPSPDALLPGRFRALFWVLSLNTAALAVEAIFQRLLGAERMLALRAPYDGRADLMFGPFAYRGNAAQYMNLAWPAILAFWWVLREEARRRAWDSRKIGGGPHLFLLVCAIVVASAPIVAGSPSGAAMVLLLLVFSIFVMFLSRRGSWRTRCTIVLVCLSVVALGGALGWDQLAPRLREFYRTPYASPHELYENAKQMALDYPLYGIGPGAFRALYPLYRADPKQDWHAFLHDDWMETRVTFGWAGSMLVLCLLCLALARWFAPGGLPGPWEFVALLWGAVGACLINAKFSFPLQVYSILLLFLVLLAVLSCLSRPEP